MVDISLPPSYRGITLTSIISKVLEKVVYNQVNTFLNDTNALNEQQYGFRKLRTCADLLTATVDDWLLARDRKLTTAIVFLDLSKAFYNVQHEQLLLHLQKLNIGGTVLKWFSNYLKGRSQKVVLHGHVSEEFPWSKGVPQGSVLGPLLFNIYVADLHPMASRYIVSLPSFADDMSLYCSTTS